MNTILYSYIAEVLAIVATLFAGTFFLIDHVPGQRKDVPAKVFVSSIVILAIYVLIY